MHTIRSTNIVSSFVSVRASGRSAAASPRRRYHERINLRRLALQNRNAHRSTPVEGVSS